ncbi:alanine racemase [Aggregicoccus sp. 17bor-14]|uniref:alanine racemase n=1 Tax=Myxococcaceae TaxID=31 RepID=UPI00129C9DF1|nr:MULTISPECIES: alanine racemase [Myxococcaceae]MBF5040830.1 alanine racemase [Simulacricoccus sp. 17bor-14]MRI86619.1 alanine racemase [Aggregicoccus sp. 17bor-14]
MAETAGGRSGAGATPGCASWLELSAQALRENVALFRTLEGAHATPRSLGSVLKGNAYGHGFEQMLPLVHDSVDVLYVITPQDGLAIREWERAGAHPQRQVLVIGAIVAEEAVALARAGVDAVLADTSWVDMVPVLRAARLTQPLRVHVHLDTGLGREGFTLAQLPGDVAFLRDSADVLEVVGALSHFANTEDVTEQAYAQSQLDTFEEGLTRLRGALPHTRTLQRHMAASAASFALPRSRYEALRIGISLYGLWPSPETRLSTKLVLGHVPTLHPVLRWRCPSQVVKWLPAGSYVGYGCTYRCSEPTRVAVLPVGYFDGYPRLLSGRAHVLVNGRRCPVLGRVMMNHIVVDVTRAARDERPVVATLIGNDGDESVSAETVAGWAQTISYELVTRIGSHLKRVVVD